MRVVTTTTETVAQHMKWRTPRNHHIITQETDPTPPRCKSTISSLLLSTFSNNNNHTRKKTNFSAAATFRGLGCTAGASHQVSVPAVIRSSAEWEGKKVRKKKHKRSSSSSKGGGCIVDFEHVWCGAPPARNNASSRPKIDVHKISHNREPSSSSFLGRRSVNPETMPLLHTHPTHHVFTPHDQFRDWRLDVDNMSYEQLLELGDRIGYVNTGLKENEMGGNITKTKLLISDHHDDASNHQCTICQEDYEASDELGSLHCDHTYHLYCIKQWLAHKNFCPVCKQQVVPRNN